MTESFAVIEIASDSIGGAVIYLPKEGLPKVVFSVRNPVNFLLDVNFEAFWRSTRQALEKTIEDLHNFDSKLDNILCVFLSPWFVSQTKIINISQETPFKITDNFLKSVLDTEEKNFKSKYISAVGSLKGTPDFIEHEIIKTELNGYYTDKPVGKTAKTAKIGVYMSLGVKEVEEEIKKEISKKFHDINLYFKTFPLLAFKVLGEIDNTQKGLVLVDMGGEITDISLIKNGAIEETISFPLGKNFLLRKIASKLNTFPQEAESMLKTYLRRHSGNSEKIENIINEAEEEWCEYLVKSLEKISERGLLPMNILIIGEENIGNRFIKCAEREKFSQFTFLNQPFKVNNFLADKLSNYFEFKTQNTDAFLVLESFFANKFL